MEKIEVTYDRAKDTLYAEILPARPARVDGFEFDFYIRYDWDDPSKIVGFEWLDFSKGYQGVNHIDEIITTDVKFDIKNTKLKNLTLREVFDWAYKTYVQELVVLDEFLISSEA